MNTLTKEDYFLLAYPAPLTFGKKEFDYDGDAGMYMRDFFASKALGMMIFEDGTPYKHYSEIAYGIADAMLEARKETIEKILKLEK